MKKCLFLLVSVIFFNMAFAEKLVLINYQNDKELKSYFSNENLRINYYSDNLIIATARMTVIPVILLFWMKIAGLVSNILFHGSIKE